MRPSSNANPSSSARLGQAMAAAFALLFALSALVACPAKEVEIDISDAGIGYVIKSCGIECTTDCCTVPAGDVPTEAYRVQLELLLVTAGAQSDYSGAKIRARSPCMQLRLGCDFTGASGELASCLAVQLNELIAQGMPEGLGFDGLDDPDDVLVVLAFYSVPETADARQCLASDVFACAGLTERLDERYDITCASCNGSERADDPSSSANVAPCVGDCFIENCHALLALQGA